MNPLDVGDVGAESGIGQGAILADGLRLKVGSEVGKRVLARVVVVLVAADESADGKDGSRIEQTNPRWRDVEGLDLRALIRRADGHSVGIEAIIVGNQTFPGGRVLSVEGIRGLEPGTGEAQVQVNGIGGGELVVHAVENVLFVAFVVHYGELGRIEEAAAVQPVRRDEVSPLVAAVGEVEADIGGSKRAVGSGHAASGLG